MVDSQIGFGAAIAFLTTISVLAGERKKNSQIVNDAQVAVIKTYLDSGKLSVSVSLNRDATASDDSPSSCWRHIRNCFAHGNWYYDEDLVVTTEPVEIPFELKDFTSDGKMNTFEATIDMVELLRLAEQLLIVTFEALP